MSDQTPQNFANHGKNPAPILVVVAVILLGVIMAFIGCIKVKSIVGLCLIGTGTIFVGVGAIAGLLIARSYSTKLQDRIIRTEMHLRLTAILPDDLQSVIAGLTNKQLIGLRFASDEEMADLVRQVQSDNLETATSIKKLVKNWQPDHDRV